MSAQWFSVRMLADYLTRWFPNRVSGVCAVRVQGPIIWEAGSSSECVSGACVLRVCVGVP